MTDFSHGNPHPFRWVLLGGLGLSLIYLPSLTTRFDFVDDGNLVYPTAAASFADRAGVVWDKIADNYDHLGPFRPTLWVHWEIAAELLQGNEIAWRATRLVWCAFAATALLALLRELRIPPPAAIGAAAVAMGNPYRNEIWTSLTLSEGVAMPYAMLALLAARRATSSSRPWAWDILAVACVLVALGCKNTFAALVPVQVFLRTVEDGAPLRECVRRNGRRAAVLGLTLLAPAAHYVYFRLNWHPGQYLPGGPTLAQARRVVSGVLGSASLDFMGAGLFLAVLAQAARVGGGSGWLHELATKYRAAVGAGVLLLLGGVALYLPMDAMSGRYSMPAAWGLDLLNAVLLAGLVTLPGSRLKTSAFVTLGIGLVAVVAASVGKQQKFAAKADLLWQVLEHVERTAPPNATVAWVCGNSLAGEFNEEEGIHFQWHLSARVRADLRFVLLGPDGRPLPRREITSGANGPPNYALWGGNRTAPPPGWTEKNAWSSSFWMNRRQFVGHFGTPAEPR